MDALPGTLVVFNIQAAGTEPLSYLWECKMGSGSGGWQLCDVEFANSSTLTLPSVLKSNEGSYCCTVSNLAGSETSECATLTVGELEYVYYTERQQLESCTDNLLLNWLSLLFMSHVVRIYSPTCHCIVLSCTSTFIAQFRMNAAHTHYSSTAELK